MDDELILIEKDGEQIRVHPGTLENHLSLGWKKVEPAEEVAEEPAEESDEEKPAARKSKK